MSGHIAIRTCCKESRHRRGGTIGNFSALKLKVFLIDIFSVQNETSVNPIVPSVPERRYAILFEAAVQVVTQIVSILYLKSNLSFLTDHYSNPRGSKVARDNLKLLSPTVTGQIRRFFASINNMSDLFI